LDVNKTSFFLFFIVSLSKQQSTQQCYILAVQDVTESVCGHCSSSAMSALKIASVLNRCYYCRSDYNRSCAAILRLLPRKSGGSERWPQTAISPPPWKSGTKVSEFPVC